MKTKLITLAVLLITANQVQASDDWEINLNVTPISGTAPMSVSIQTTIMEAPTIAPASFTKEWLAGKILYQVWFGSGDAPDGAELFGVAVVGRVSFGTDGTIIFVGLKNSSDGSGVYNVDSSGGLYIGDPQETNTIVCGSTSQYIKTHYEKNGVFDNTDLYFFNESDAMTYANTLTSMIPPCGD